MRCRSWIRVLAGSALALTQAEAFAANVPGTSAQLSWSAASGPVLGYAVEVSRGTGPFVEISRVALPSARVTGQIGDTLRVRVLAFDANGRFGPASVLSDPITFVAAPPPVPRGDPRLDLDGNGLSDAMAVGPTSGVVSAALLQPDGSRLWVVIGQPRDTGMRPVGSSDVDGDGRVDLLFRNSLSGANELWLLRGLTYSVIALPAQAVRFRVAAFRDFSGDGRADVLFHSEGTGQSVVWTLAAAGLTGTLAVDPAPTGAALAAVADVDGDRSPDLVWQRLATRALEAWLLRGVIPRAVVSLGVAPSSARVVGVGDFDADGVEDLVWHRVSASVSTLDVWFLAGANAPRTGIALRLLATSELRGVVDVNSDGTDDLVVATGTTAASYGVKPVLAAAAPPQWTTQALPLSGTPLGGRKFLTLD